MSEVRLVIRDAERAWSGTIHGSCADRAIAALSADPVTMDEFELATARFEKPCPDFPFFSNLSHGDCDEPYDAGIVVIDLIARMVFFESSYSHPSQTGTVNYHNGQYCTNITIQYHLADDWQFHQSMEGWRSKTDKRRQELATKPLLDARAVFYGRPLLEFIARECFDAFSRRDAITAAVRLKWIEAAKRRRAAADQIPYDEIDIDQLTENEIVPHSWHGNDRNAGPFYETIVQIHIDWLLTPREDLHGACPREVALDRRGHIVWDLQDRSFHWMEMKACPQILDESSHAYRFAGFGTHELVVYYGLVRELLHACWTQLTTLSESPQISQRPESLTIQDFLTAEIPRLQRGRDGWLDFPSRDYRGSPPRQVIRRERARLPEMLSGSAAMIDPDCPLCQMMGESTGMGFWGYDGSEMEDEFAFDMSCRTRVEWDEKQHKSEEFRRRFNAEWEEKERLGVSDLLTAKKSNPEWSRLYSMGDIENVPLGLRIFELGGQLASLIVGLRSGCDRESVPRETQQQIDALNHDFSNLREVLLSTDETLADALIVPVVDRFLETIAGISATRADVRSECEFVIEELQNLMNPESDSPFEDDECGDNDDDMQDEARY